MAEQQPGRHAEILSDQSTHSQGTPKTGVPFFIIVSKYSAELIETTCRGRWKPEPPFLQGKHINFATNS